MEIPIEEVHYIAFRPISIVGDILNLDFIYHLVSPARNAESFPINGIFCMPTDMTIATILSMEQSFISIFCFGDSFFIILINIRIPSRPYRRGEYIDYIRGGREFPCNSETIRIKFLSKIVQLL